MNQPVESFKTRLKKIMDLRTLKPVELAEKCGISKSTVSHYMSGYTEPKSNRLYIMAKILNVNEAWLMGYDVPMERDNYEDQKVITFEAKLETAITLLEEGGYTVSYSDDPKDDIITIISAKHEPVSCIHEYELLNKYDSLQQRNMLTAEALAEIDLIALDKYKAARKEYARQWNIQFFERKILDSFSQLNDENKKKSIAYTENLLSNQKLEEEISLAAAHKRTDIPESTEETQADLDMVSDENF